MSTFYKTDLEEQESIINIDYAKKEVNLYTSRKTVYGLLVKRLGEPTQTFYTDKKISGASWKVPFADKKNMAVVFSRTVLMGGL